MKKIALMAVALFFAGSSMAQKESVFVKHVVFPERATMDQKIDMASRLVPTAQQLAWQRGELTAFLHFGMNTFTGKEWGAGNEDPALFNPTNFDAMQWARTLKEAGFKMAILTAKHHDGFCLWPSQYTKHSVAYSPWKGGKGDVVKEVMEACRHYGLRFGVYLSPWDRNSQDYGNSPVYNKYYVNQLTELLTHYGAIDEVWFDGANGEGPNGKKQEYDWTAIYNTVHKLQPHAVMAIMGDDVRWVGNENGLGRPTEWSATVLAPEIYASSKAGNKELGIDNMSKDLGSRTIIDKAKEMFWYPSEVDVSIRPGWFYHAEEDSKVKSLKELVDIYFQSVGYNSVLLLNIPPDRRGLLHEADVTRLKEFHAYLQKNFSHDLLGKGGKAYWETDKGKSRIYKLASALPFNVLMLQEDISKGQRVEAFTVEAHTAKGWKVIAEATTIGYKRLIRLPRIIANEIRINIKEARGKVSILRVAVYNSEEL